MFAPATLHDSKSAQIGKSYVSVTWAIAAE